MMMPKLAKGIVAAGTAAALACGLFACSSGNGSAAAEQADQGTAAIVFGSEIKEYEVTAQVDTARMQMGLQDDTAWAQWLGMNGYTPSAIRDQLLDPLIDLELIRHGAAELGITVPAEELDAHIASVRANFIVLNSDGVEDKEKTDEAWQEALAQRSFTEESYRYAIESQMLQQKVAQKFSEEAEPSEEVILEMSQMYASYYDGKKRSSHILFDANDRETAQMVLDQINAGEIDFADAAMQYSLDGSAANGGDVDFDTGNFVPEYSEALAALEEGQVSGLVESQYGIHIIKCTEDYHAPETVTGIDDAPKTMHDAILETARSSSGNEAYTAWLQEQRTAAEASGDLVINPMPENISYNVDVTPYLPSAPSVDPTVTPAEPTAEGESASGDAASTDEATAEGQSADAAAAGEASAASAEAAEPAGQEQAEPSQEAADKAA